MINKKFFYKLFFFLFLAACAVFLSFCSRIDKPGNNTTVATESIYKPSVKPGQAILLNGPGIQAGLPGFGLNAFPCLYGSYLLADAKNEQASQNIIEIEIWFTKEFLYYDEAWQNANCSSLPSGLILHKQNEGAYTLWALSHKDYSLLLRFPVAYENHCRFITVLEERFSFFYRYTEQPEDISFPAVLSINYN